LGPASGLTSKPAPGILGALAFPGAQEIEARENAIRGWAGGYLHEANVVDRCDDPFVPPVARGKEGDASRGAAFPSASAHAQPRSNDARSLDTKAGRLVVSRRSRAHANVREFLPQEGIEFLDFLVFGQ
jgi:hypothetical protein